MTNLLFFFFGFISALVLVGVSLLGLTIFLFFSYGKHLKEKDITKNINRKVPFIKTEKL